MKRRCYNPNAINYKDYGGRGIVMCDTWRDSFEAFYADMGEPPTPRHSIDRYPDRDGNYESGNCRWATSKEQSDNSTNTRVLSFNGLTMNVTEWARHLGIRQSTLSKRLAEWPVERALSCGRLR